jgi:hypothetical protein
VKYCGDPNLKHNFKKSKIPVRKKGNRLKVTKRKSMYKKTRDLAEEENDLAVTLENEGRSNRKKTRTVAKHYHA